MKCHELFFIPKWPKNYCQKETQISFRVSPWSHRRDEKVHRIQCFHLHHKYAFCIYYWRFILINTVMYFSEFFLTLMSCFKKIRGSTYHYQKCYCACLKHQFCIRVRRKTFVLIWKIFIVRSKKTGSSFDPNRSLSQLSCFKGALVLICWEW